MEHKVKKLAKRFLHYGVWQRDSWIVRIDGEEHDFRDLAKKYGIKLKDADKPKKSKKQINIDVKVEEHADLEKPLDSGHTEIDGDGDSEVSE
jgi:hypothetical protein